MNKTKNIVLAESVELADSTFSRMKGLLGRKFLEQTKVLQIPNCNSIQTCFMQFSIDAIFVDRNLKVKRIKKNIRPWRIVLPILSARTVFEFSAGTILEERVSLGDQLYVGN